MSRITFYGIALLVVTAVVVIGRANARDIPPDAKPLAEWQPYADCFADRRGFERVPLFVVERGIVDPSYASDAERGVIGGYYDERHKIVIARTAASLDEESDRLTVAHELLHAHDGFDLAESMRSLAGWRHSDDFYDREPQAVIDLETCMVIDGHKRMWRLDEAGRLMSLRTEHRMACMDAAFAEAENNPAYDASDAEERCDAEWNANAR